MKKELNLSLLCDFYEFSMANGYFKKGLKEHICYFDVFFRKIPDNGGFVIAAGLEQVVEYIQNLHFTQDDLTYLRAQNLFDEEFLSFLKDFRFTGDIYAVKEGEVVFPYEPILSVRAKACEAQILETFILLALNHQSLIATKTNRIVYAAQGKNILEFGSRRAQGVDAAINGARAAFIGGASATACTLAAQIYDMQPSGTMAHSWVQMFENEFEAFKHYCELYPKNAILLIDTYDTLKSGLINAIKAFDVVFKDRKNVNLGIRLDSGDLCELSKQARNMLDDAGYKDCKIIASGSLDEYKIKSLLEKGAKIDAFGVGEKLITAKSSPVLGCVYKLVAIENKNTITPKIKISENNEKITNPSLKKLYRFFDKTTNKAVYDKLYLQDEVIKDHENLKAIPLQIPIFKEGKLVYKLPNLKEIQAYAAFSLSHFESSLKDIEKPSQYEILLSKKLQKLKDDLIALRSKQ